ncbi:MULTISPECIES: energy transducer TonB [Microvirgula]|nr:MULTISPECIES: energy transducer TonB [Microvirgula]
MSRPLIPAAVSLAHIAVLAALAGVWVVERAPIPPRPLQAMLYTPAVAAPVEAPPASAPPAPQARPAAATAPAHSIPTREQADAPADITRKTRPQPPAPTAAPAAPAAPASPPAAASAAPDSSSATADGSATASGGQGRHGTQDSSGDGPHEARIISSMYSNRPPTYPAASRSLGEEGRVILKVRVNAAGRPESIDIDTSSGFPRLDRAATDAVHRWRFEPAMSQGQPVAGWVRVPILFRLDNSR